MVVHLIRLMNNLEFSGNRAVVDFEDVETVNEMMGSRPHVIDGRQVVVHRSISGYDFDVTEWDSPFLELTFPKQSLTVEEIQTYYQRFSAAKNLVACDRSGEQWIIEFFEYESNLNVITHFLFFHLIR